MQFDIFTTLAASCSVIFLLGLILVFFWSRNRRNAWFGWWSIAFLTLGVANILVMAKTSMPDYLHSALASAMLVFGFNLVWQATRVFEGRRLIHWPVVLCIVVWLSLFFLPEIRGNQAIRIGITSFEMGLFLALASYESWRNRAEQLPSRIGYVVVLALTALVFFARVPLAPIAPYPFGAAPVDALVVTGFNGVLIALSLMSTVLLISMTQERSEKGQRHLAQTDALTGLLNRRGLEQTLTQNELPAGAALVVFDLDRFKTINDTFGHAAGDIVISGFAQMCREHLRQVDFAARFGGEEFVLVLPRTELSAALALAERMRFAFGRTVFDLGDGAIACTVSGGVFAAPRDYPIWFATALAEADAALYRAKEAGRDRVFGPDMSAAGATSGSRIIDERCVAPERLAASA